MNVMNEAANDAWTKEVMPLGRGSEITKEDFSLRIVKLKDKDQNFKQIT